MDSSAIIIIFSCLYSHLHKSRFDMMPWNIKQRNLHQAPLKFTISVYKLLAVQTDAPVHQTNHRWHIEREIINRQHFFNQASSLIKILWGFLLRVVEPGQSSLVPGPLLALHTALNWVTTAVSVSQFPNLTVNISEVIGCAQFRTSISQTRL